MSSYRFCRTDDIQLLVDALNRCWAPYFPDEPPMTTAAFKRSIRGLHVWCSSCMVAFAGADPIGVLIGAKRPTSTLIHRIAVHPDHVRQGHGRHLLESLGSKLAILGPPRIVAEVPESLGAACGLFQACGYREEAVLTDYVLGTGDQGPRAGASTRVESLGSLPSTLRRETGGQSSGLGTGSDSGFVIPITIDDLEANGLLEGGYAQAPWERSVETLTARKADIAGLAVASDERIEAYILYVQGEIMALRSLVEDAGAGLKQLVSRLRAQGLQTLQFRKVHPAELSEEAMAALGFRPAGGHRLFAITASS